MEKTKSTAAKKKATTKKTAVKKTATKKVAAKKTVKASAPKAALKKTAAKKSAPKKTATRKTAKKTIVDNIDPTLEIVIKCAKALDDKKAEDLRILDVQGKSPITNYFIVATATSEPHIRALSNELDKTLKELGVKAVGRDYNSGSGWVVVDGFDFMAHIFLKEERGMYGIESLWKDAEVIKL